MTRWERITETTAPAPVIELDDGELRPAPEFVEWLMGLPHGWVTNPILGLSPTQQLTALGNGVLPAQAAHALRVLLSERSVNRYPTENSSGAPRSG